VPKSRLDGVKRAIRDEMRAFTVGDPADPKTAVGPMVSQNQYERVQSYIRKGIEEGAEVLVGGEGHPAGFEAGYFVKPTVFVNVKNDMTIAQEEIFGPVLSVVRAHDYKEALALPSEHDYGNGVAIFTRDGDAARDFAARVNVGMVGINVPIPVPIAYYTFGGWKKSGFGDLNQHGPDSVRFYTKTKTVTSRWPSGVKEGAEFSIPTMK
jgi:malonate-semialdehyde dehydrogenase (acetylating)/methylmalonate-semialdehyde dehydrogenase